MAALLQKSGDQPNIHIISIAMKTSIMHPEISVIVPALNEESYLKRTLASITNQNTDTPYELIVSDKMSKKLGIADLRDYVGIR
jgi:cellulose synthase/poly-beta-1,6-N-acetylglucosamine synthase-like glycosyltransferase